MSNQLGSGFSLKDDIASIQTDSTFHDVTLLCSDGIEIGACRAILASRSSFFKDMLYGIMQGATPNKIILRNIKSTALYTVLQFIHTENIDSMAISAAIDVYRAANFLLLPNLMKLALERANDNKDFEVAASLLNEATISLPWSENTKDLYDMLLKPFYTHSLSVGNLNGFSEDALELLLTRSEMTELNTPEYNLLLCIVEWAWTRNANALSAVERRTIFNAISRMPVKPTTRILIGHNHSDALLLKMMQYVDFTLICPHRLKSLTEAVDVLTETSPQYLAFCHYACKNTKCSTDHPSESRRALKRQLKWDQSKLVSNLVLSEDCAVVENNYTNTKRSVRATTRCVADCNGLCEWDIVVESNGLCGGNRADRLGFVLESFDGFETGSIASEWCFNSFNGLHQTYMKGNLLTDGFGRQIKKGDVITFHLNLNDYTCGISINGINYGTAWTNLPRNMNLYPAATLFSNAKYRIRPHVRPIGRWQYS